MKLKMKITSAIVFLTLALVMGQGCAQSFESNQADQRSLSDANCVLPKGISGSPVSIRDVVQILNALPKPTSISCYLASLDRPLKVSLTNNSFSAQPAVGNRSPRVFILNQTLITSVAMDGFGKDVIEFSELTSEEESIKAELEFPVTGQLSGVEPVTQILQSQGATRTVCSACHAAERPASDSEYTSAFVSRALQPSVSTLIPVSGLRSEVDICNSKDEPDRCAKLKALFGRGAVEETEFPASLPSF